MILQSLRDHTRPAHELLETHIDLLGREWSLPFYRQLLQKFYGFYAAVEPGILAHPQWQDFGFDVEKRRKLPSLQRDLQYLGLTQPQIEALPLANPAPSVDSFAQALGAAYVLEGSTLGGQIITRHLTKELGVDAENGCSFFASYGAEVGPMWREFVGVLDSYQADEAERNALVGSACLTFSRFDQWLADIL